MKRRYWFLALAVVAGVGALALHRAREPRYHGKGLSYWFAALDGIHTAEHEEAVKQIGKGCLPLIERYIRAKDTSLKRGVIVLLSSQSLFKFNLSTAEQKRTRAAAAVFILGETARPLLPQLQKALYDPDTARPAARALMGIGSDGFAAVTNAARHPDRELRMAVVLSSQILVGSTNVERQAMLVPVLIDLLKDPEPDIRAMAANALGQLQAAPTLAIPALISVLDDPQLFPRYNAATALGSFGLAATNALPALRACANRTGSATERQLLIQAMLRIDPDRVGGPRVPSGR
jgi:hypothetical protein